MTCWEILAPENAYTEAENSLRACALTVGTIGMTGPGL